MTNSAETQPGANRPFPPADLLEETIAGLFIPSTQTADWIRDTFIEEGATLENEDHVHLRYATIGVLWTNVGNSRQGRRVIGQCEVGQPRGSMGKWSKARAEQQITEWFGDVPDFIITLDAHYCAQCADIEFVALVEHELYHAAQDKDAFGAPKFNDAGRPVFTMRGHDVEEFVGVVRRYGADAAGVRELVEAAQSRPLIGTASVAQACGTCLLRVA